MDQAASVDRVQALGEPGRQDTERGWIQGAVFSYGPGQGEAGDVGGGDPRRIGGGVGVHDLGGVETTDPSRGLGLPGEAGTETGLGREFGSDDLDDELAAGRCAGQVDLAHTAGAESCDQPVPADLRGVVGVKGVHGVGPFCRGVRRSLSGRRCSGGGRVSARRHRNGSESGPKSSLFLPSSYRSGTSR